LGIVKRQAFYNAIFNYTGQIIGYVNVIVLFPILLTQEEFGLTRLLASMAFIFAQLSAIGSQRVIIKYFPFFRRPDGMGDNGLLPIVLLNVTVGFGIVTSVFWLLKDYFLSTQDSELFHEFYLVIPLLAFLIMLNWVLESYLIALLKTSFTSFLNNVLLKILWLGAALAYYYDLVGLEAFVWFYCSVHFVLVLFMTGYLIQLKEVSIRISKAYYKWRLLKHLYRYGAYTMLDKSSSTLMNNLDKIMIGFLILDDLRSVAIYAVAAQLSGIVVIPATSMNRILAPMISHNWKNKQMDLVAKTYHQSTVINMVFTGALCVLVWTNIDGIMHLVNKDYTSGVYTILFLMLSRFVGVSFGLNGDILVVSKHFWMNTVSGVILIGLMIVFNLIFIPIYGFVGAAFGTLLARIAYNVLRFIFLLVKEGLNPFKVNNLIGFAILLAGLIVGSLVQFDSLHFLIEIGLKGALVSLVIGIPTYYFKVSEDINSLIDDLIRKGKKLLY
jgi:O-antigen/teichoic acid export membrane protein